MGSGSLLKGGGEEGDSYVSPKHTLFRWALGFQPSKTPRCFSLGGSHFEEGWGQAGGQSPGSLSYCWGPCPALVVAAPPLCSQKLCDGWVEWRQGLVEDGNSSALVGGSARGLRWGQDHLGQPLSASPAFPQSLAGLGQPEGAQLSWFPSWAQPCWPLCQRLQHQPQCQGSSGHQAGKEPRVSLAPARTDGEGWMFHCPWPFVLVEAKRGAESSSTRMRWYLVSWEARQR